MNLFVGKAIKVMAAFLIFGNLMQAAAQGDSLYQLPAGTRIRLKMDGGISSSFSNANDTFTGTVAKAVMVRDVVVLPAGAVIEGRVLSVSRPVSGHAGTLEVAFETLRIKKDADRAIEGVLVEKIKAESSWGTNALIILGGVGIGALIGTLSKANNGAAIGAGVGAGGGLAAALIRKGKNVGIRGNQEFEIELKKDVTLPVIDY